MLLSQVTIQADTRDGPKEIWFLFESDHDDLKHLHDDLVEEGSIFGHRIETAGAGPGARREVSRYPFILSHRVVQTICPPQFTLTRAA